MLIVPCELLMLEAFTEVTPTPYNDRLRLDLDILTVLILGKLACKNVLNVEFTSPTFFPLR